MPDFSHEIEIVSELSRKAGKAILDLYGRPMTIAYKGSNDPVTEADRKANALIVEGLSRHFPQDTLVAEESPLPPHSLKSGRVWYIDPLDGTKEFMAGNGEFSVMIGLSLDGRSQCGVVYWPIRDELFAGNIGGMAWQETHGHRHALSSVQSINLQSFTLIASRSHPPPQLDLLKQSLGITQEQTMGSVGLKVAQIVQGKADVYVELSGYTRAWDACAPEAILRAAGGSFTDAHGQPIHYGQGACRNVHGLVAGTHDCHARVIRVTDRLCSCRNG